MYDSIESVKAHYEAKWYLTTKCPQLGPLVFIYYSGTKYGGPFRFMTEHGQTLDVSTKVAIKLYKLGIIQEFSLGY